MPRHPIPYLVVLLVPLLAACASSAPSERTGPSTIEPQEFIVFLSDLEQRRERGELRPLNRNEARRFEKLSADIREMLAGIEDIGDLRYDDRLEVFNKTEELRAIVSGNDDDQVVCKRERKVGTRFRITQCRTMAEIRWEREVTEQGLRDVFPRGGPPAGSGGP